MTGLARDDARLSARFQFPAEFIGFQGHFPEKKILPGVCQVQCVLALLEKGFGKNVVLKEIVQAKYFSPVFPDDEVMCAVSDLGDPGSVMTVKAAITKGAAKVSEMKLRVLMQTK
jgi:3-hydroxyacyl-[acyl-carrier-protein] dehydratase